MTAIAPEKRSLPQPVIDYRRRTFAIRDHEPLCTADDAVQFVSERGFIFFWPTRGIEFPSLWTAVAGERPVPKFHDDPGHITWNWKDSLLGQKKVYYARVLRRRNTFISLTLLPSFYALSWNFGDFETDYLDQYYEGKLTAQAKTVYEALLKHGPLNSLDLRQASHMSTESSFRLFEKALNELMADFKILPIGVSNVGAWHYSHIFDITARHYPQLPEQSRLIHENQARQAILKALFQSLGQAELKEVIRLLGWPSEAAAAAIHRLTEEKFLAETAHQTWVLSDMASSL